MEDRFELVSDAPAKSGSLMLRPYQVDGVQAILAALEDRDRALAIMATGTGKTELGADLIRRETQCGRGVLFITPLKQLVWQTAERLRSRGIPCGVEQGSNRSHDLVTVACYASLLSRKRYERFIGMIGLIIVDEVHTNFSKRALEMLGHLTQGGVRLLGLTASPERSKGDPLTSFYGDVAFYYPIQAATEDGWLVPSRVWLSVVEGLDLSRVQSSRFGDFNADDLARVMAQEAVVQSVASLIEQHYEGMPSVVFCASIRQTEMLIDILARRGIRASMVHSEMDDHERRMHLSDFEEGRVDIIANVGVLTLGWDSPKVRKLFLARPTKSKAVYVQQYGRGTRAIPGVVDNLPTAEERRAAIAASAKPFFEVFDITDSSRLNDLCSSLDVLRPELDRELMRRTKRSMENRGSVSDIDAVVEAARAQAAREQEARDRLEWHKRREITVDSQFGNYERDIYQHAEQPPKPKRWHMLFGKHKGQPLTAVPSQYLAWVVRESNCRNQDFLAAIRRELAKRRDGRS